MIYKTPKMKGEKTDKSKMKKTKQAKRVKGKGRPQRARKEDDKRLNAES